MLKRRAGDILLDVPRLSVSLCRNTEHPRAISCFYSPLAPCGFLPVSHPMHPLPCTNVGGGNTPPSPSKPRLVAAEGPSLQLQVSMPNHLSSLTASGVKPISTCLHHPPLHPTSLAPADRYCRFYFLASILFFFNPLICFSPALLIGQSADFSSSQQ